MTKLSSFLWSSLVICPLQSHKQQTVWISVQSMKPPAATHFYYVDPETLIVTVGSKFTVEAIKGFPKKNMRDSTVTYLCNMRERFCTYCFCVAWGLKCFLCTIQLKHLKLATYTPIGLCHKLLLHFYMVRLVWFSGDMPSGFWCLSRLRHSRCCPHYWFQGDEPPKCCRFPHEPEIHATADPGSSFDTFLPERDSLRAIFLNILI